MKRKNSEYLTRLKSLFAMIPYALGWACGKLVLFIKFVYNAIRVGYLDALGDDAWRSEIYRY